MYIGCVMNVPEISPTAGSDLVPSVFMGSRYSLLVSPRSRGWILLGPLGSLGGVCYGCVSTPSEDTYFPRLWLVVGYCLFVY